VGCGPNQIPTYGYKYSDVLDMASNGSIVGNISGLSGLCQVIYDPLWNLYYAAAYQDLAIRLGELSAGEKRYSPAPQVVIINASDNKLIQSLRTGNITSHTVAVDPKTKQMVVPIKKEGITVYSVESIEFEDREGVVGFSGDDDGEDVCFFGVDGGEVVCVFDYNCIL
jgi:hypothetical protein